MNVYSISLHFHLQCADNIRRMIRLRKYTVATLCLQTQSCIFKEIHHILVGKSVKTAVHEFLIGYHILEKFIHVTGIGDVASAFSRDESFFPSFSFFSNTWTSLPFSPQRSMRTYRQLRLLRSVLYSFDPYLIFYRLQFISGINLIFVQMSSSVSSVSMTSSCFFIQSATTSALITLSGATRESTIDAISLLAIRLQEE